MADWNLPTLTNNYPDFLTFCKARDFDAASLFLSPPTNPQEGMIRFFRANLLFQEYLSGVWTDRILAIAGGGTGANSASGARGSLGLGTMATQNANSVAISGGSITGIAFDATVIATGNLNIARMPTGGTWNLTTLLQIAGHAFHAKAIGINYRIGAGTTLTDTDGIYECSGGTIFLPDATTISGRLYIVKRSGSTVTFDPFGAQVININGADVATYAALANNQAIILQSNGTKWIAITMGGIVYKDNQFVTITLSTGNSQELQAITPITEVRKAIIHPVTEMTLPSGGVNFPLRCFFSDNLGNEVTSGAATHVKLITHDPGATNGFNPLFYNIVIEERE